MTCGKRGLRRTGSRRKRGAQSLEDVGTELQFLCKNVLSLWQRSTWFLTRQVTIGRVHLLEREDNVGGLEDGSFPSCPLQGGFSRAFWLNAAVTEP